jgi:hypothetical protein
MKTVVLAVFLSLAVASASASTLILGGFEDTPGSSGDHDYNDITFTIAGAALHTITGFYTPLTPSVINDSGNVFWDHVSADGPNDNIGNIWIDNYTGVQYLANPGGLLDPDVWFSGGSTVTITGGQTADTDTLYECSLGGIDCHQIVGSYTFTPTGDWEVMAQVNGGAKYYSDPLEQQTSSFAFATDATTTPEPNAAVLVGIGLALVLTARARHWRASRRRS